MLLIGLVHRAAPDHGGEFLSTMSCVCPGADKTPTLGVLIGTGYGLVDGAAAGWLFSWLYQAFDRTRRT
jgi:hypothetical protein